MLLEKKSNLYHVGAILNYGAYVVMDIRLVSLCTFFRVEYPMMFFTTPILIEKIMDFKMWFQGQRIYFSRDRQNIISYMTMDSRGLWVTREITAEVAVQLFITKEDYFQCIGEPMCVNYKREVEETTLKNQEVRNKRRRLVEWGVVSAASVVIGYQLYRKYTHLTDTGDSKTK